MSYLKMENGPARHGAPWLADEEEKLLELIKNNKNIHEITEEHERTLGSIRSKLKYIGIKMYEKGETIDSIIKKLKFIDKEDLEKFINTRKDNKKKKEIKKDDTNTDNLSKILEIMKEMMNTMNILVSIEMKKNNLKLEDLELNKKNKEIKEDNEEDNNSEDDEEFIWKEKIIKKIIKHIDNKSKLEDLRNKYDIDIDIFYKKVKFIKKDMENNESTYESDSEDEKIKRVVKSPIKKVIK